ncbi:lipoprotein-releasing ABC transporter permease subunit [Lysobacter pythonis]|uniref:Lipoprotein-releasing ABC transporter permease subunit n=1 Tax=Solilutibacter pythonis TaxID=2483112 RepID=A0A3M2I4P1_9GAMM|nr:lipoprotein-releasing ABC transporter permease subunit [Lysobacter pythonis]RMH94990.1 lipoprotein-releasing ABC transporter permease subunit [Lysobacter pythonis]
MFKPLPVAIGLRYLRAKRRNGFISFISMASILGIALGVAVLITTLAVMGGFQREIRDRMLQMVAHATIAADGAEMPNWREVIDHARKDNRVAGAAPYVDTQGLIQGPREQPAMIRGIDPAQEKQVSVIADKMRRGTLETLAPGGFNIVLGRELAAWLGVGVGDNVVVMTSKISATPVGAVPQTKRFTVSGIFDAGYNEFDKGLALVNIQDIQRVLRMNGGVTGVRLRMHDMDDAGRVATDLALGLGGPYRVSDWMYENANMFHALKMEKTVMGILLSLIIAMGAFNLVSSQVMLVTDKQADIAIQRTLGVTPAQVMQTFMVQGSLIGLIGTVAGVVGGILLTLNLESILEMIESILGVKLLPEDVYYITGLPTELRADNVAITACVALAMAFLATIYPAWRASRTPPAEALRYE